MRSAAVILLLVAAAEAHAGMPSISLSEVGVFRLQSLSFFLALLLGLALLTRWLWNSLRRDFPSLPKLRFRAALGLMALWGLLVLVVLGMISGARELLTPRAWVKSGATHRIAADAEAEPAVRRAALEDLRDALWRWAEAHDGALPPHEFGAELPERRWLVPGLDGQRFRYHASTPRGGRGLLAWEPESAPSPRWVVRGDGTVEALDTAAIAAALAEQP